MENWILHLETSSWGAGLLVPDTLHSEHVYNICNKAYLSKARPARHTRSYDSKLLKSCFTKVLQQQPTVNFCQFYDKVYGSTVGFGSLTRLHQRNVSRKDS